MPPRYSIRRAPEPYPGDRPGCGAKTDRLGSRDVAVRLQEAVVFGEGVSLPMRIRFADLPPDRRPQSESAKFSAAWRSDCEDGELLAEGIRSWREQRRKLL